MSHPSTEHSEPAFHSHIIEEHKKYFTFFNVALALILITAVEIVIVYLPIHVFIVFSALAILSLTKFLAVIWWFMHLRWDRALCTILFMIGLLIATGTVTALLFLFQADPNGAPM
ncbi:MAG TPA: cytochrome C oxidase subunit IV family protein [Oceanipulchritudo sp.]|nr:cytochrome C oxidase subunit IV family protein [Oceanipulchritudo sp.]